MPSETPPLRTLYKQGSSAELRTALQNLFVAELIDPSDELWLVSPWLSNVEVLDNRTFGFRHLDPGWPRASIRLATVLATLAVRGTLVHVVTRPSRSLARTPDPTERTVTAFLEALTGQAPGDRLHVVRSMDEKSEHRKGLLSKHVLVDGSMNWTHFGVQVNGEQVTLKFDGGEIAQAYLTFAARWPRETN